MHDPYNQNQVISNNPYSPPQMPGYSSNVGQQPKVEEFFVNNNNNVQVQEKPKQDLPDLIDLMSLQNNNVPNVQNQNAPQPTNPYDNPYPDFK